MVTCFKRLIKALITFILVFCILFQSLYFKPEKIEANPGAAAIAGYIMSIVGAIDMGTGGGVRGIATSLKDSLQQKVADLMGTGIYEDSNGNYVFSGSATQQIYETLLGSSAYNAIVCSNFPISANFQPPSTVLNNTAWGDINGYIQSLSNKLVLYGSDYHGTQSVIVADISNVAYIQVMTTNSSSYKQIILKLYDNTNTFVRKPIRKYYIYGTASYAYNKTDTTNENIILSIAGSYSNNNAVYNSAIETYLNSNLTALQNFNYNSVYCNKSLILCNNIEYAQQLSTSNKGVTVNNYYQNIPSIKTTVLENNDWNSIYNNYVQNIQNESNTYIDNNTGQIDIDALRKEMQKQGSIIYDAVEEGVENIIEYVSVTNQWLEKIYNLLNEISNKIESGGSSGGTTSGSTVDLTDIETYLRQMNATSSSILAQCAYIADNLPNNEQRLQQIYTILGNIYDSLQNIPAGGVTDPNKDPYAPWYPKFFGIPDTEILDTINQIEIIEQLLSGLVPLCYITGLGAVVNALGTEPVTPVFTIPVQFSNDIINVDEELEIDLEPFDDLRDIVTGGMVILFMITLGYFTIWLLKFLLDLLSKS